jgi:hypothetical protein
MLVFGTARLVDGVIAWFEPGAPGLRAPYVRPLPPEGGTYETRETVLRKAYEQLHPGVEAAQIQAMVQDRLRTEAELDRSSAYFYRFRNLLRSATLVILALPVYLYHWRKAQHSS